MKIYLIGLYDEKSEKSDVKSILKATTSYNAAKQYALDQLEMFKKSERIEVISSGESETKYEWFVTYKYRCDESSSLFGKQHNWYIRIEEIDLANEDVPEFAIPELERRCSSLEKFNDELKAENAKLNAMIAKAQSYLTLYDGGIYEDFDHLISHINNSKRILRGEEV